jgi:hypothetical protein
MARVLRYDGFLPAIMGAKHTFLEITPADVKEMRAFFQHEKPDQPEFDIVVEGQTPGDNPRAEQAKVRAFDQAGATWWIESNWALSDEEDESALAKEIASRLRLGPPKS